VYSSVKYHKIFRGIEDHRGLAEICKYKMQAKAGLLQEILLMGLVQRPLIDTVYG